MNPFAPPDSVHSIHRRLGIWILLAFVLGPAGAITSPEAKASTADNLKVFDAAWALVNNHYYDGKFNGIDWASVKTTWRVQAAASADEAALYHTINGMLSLLRDPHTHAFTLSYANKFLSSRPPQFGFGLMPIDHHWVVSEVIPGGPAESAGVRAGWILQSVDGRELGERPVGSEVSANQTETFAFSDSQDHPVSMALTTRPMAPVRVMHALFHRMLYLQFNAFQEDDFRWLEQEIRHHRSVPAVAIDLRRNLGGDIYWAGAAMDLFFDHKIETGTCIVRDGRSGAQTSHHQWLSPHYQGQVFVLVDHATASAAEMFTAILQRQHRAVIVGRLTAGAMLDSDFFPLPDGGRLQLSWADYVLPGGERLEGRGVEPDVKLPNRSLADLRSGRDPDLDAALAQARPIP